ncbi:hypothetical protein LS684_11950 [Cytobacillus spongiae]|jgi:hypothetical protein|nr:hypothetical protein [Cytobacillus spongiae]UII54393.1 hypothetical protein LS684_11950 [Cytobacillus spongiae]
MNQSKQDKSFGKTKAFVDITDEVTNDKDFKNQKPSPQPKDYDSIEY